MIGTRGRNPSRGWNSKTDRTPHYRTIASLLRSAGMKNLAAFSNCARGAWRRVSTTSIESARGVRASLFCAAAACAAVSTVAAGAPSARPQNCVPNWIPTFGEQPQVTDSAHALAVVDLPGVQPRSLFVGGAFYGAGASGARFVAGWDGERWTDPTPGMADSGVYSLIEHDDGSGRTVFAAGSFFYDNSDGQTIRRVAKWQNGKWAPLGTGLYHQVNALAVFDAGTGPDLYAGGLFTVGEPDYLARWDGSTWSSIGYPFGPVFALLVHDDGNGPNLYAASSGTNARVSSWDGASWTALGGIFDNAIRTLATFDDGSGPALYAGGAFTSAGGVAAARVAKWSGQAWQSVGAGPNGTVSVLTVHDDGSGPALYAGSGPGASSLSGVTKWDGISWSAIGSGTQYFDVRALASFDDGSGSGSKLYAAGMGGITGSVEAYAVATWDGQSWSALGEGLAASVRASISFDDVGAGTPALFAGGYFASIGGVPMQRVARWDGSAWSDMGGGVGAVNGPHVQAFEAYDDGSGAGPALYVGGYFAQAGSVTAHNIARWDGAGWSPLAAGLTGSVKCLEVYDEGAGPMLFAGGSISASGATPMFALARWDGANWSEVPGFAVGQRLESLAVFDSGAGPELYVGGDFLNVAGITARFVARWNGVSWREVGGGTNNSIAAFCLHPEVAGGPPVLFAGGNFTLADGMPALNIARWNGTNWGAVGGGLPDFVRALASFDDGTGFGKRLYVGGRFATAGTAAASRVAMWDGVKWSGLGSGAVVGDVETFTAHDDGSGSGPALFIGGQFQISPAADSFLAKWGCHPTAIVSYCTSMTSSLGCVPAASTIGTAKLASPSGFTLTATGVDGLRNGLFFYGVNGPTVSPWGPNGAGWLCVKAPLQLMSLHSSGGTRGACNGVLMNDWRAFVSARPTVLGHPLHVGQRFNAQAWHRGSGVNAATNLSDAIEFELQP
jgi:hypothetical protein